MGARVLRTDLRLAPTGEIHGPLSIGADSAAVLEAVYLILEVLSQSSGVSTKEIAADLYRMAAGKVTN